jgi:hypothetical protein
MTRALALLIAVMLLCASTSQAALIHRYSFDDGTANDSVGTFNGTLVNGAAVSGGALHLDGDNDYVEFSSGLLESATGYVGTTHTGAGTGKLSIEAWFTAPPTEMVGYFNTRVFYFGSSYSPYNEMDQNGIGLSSDDANDQAALTLTYNGWNPRSAFTSTLNTGNLKHVVAVLDNADNSMKLYVNGTLATSNSLDILNSAGVNSIYDVFNYLGRGRSWSAVNLEGSIDEFRIYDHALSPEQISINFALGPDVVPEPGTLALLAAGLLGVLAHARRRTSRAK